jgi:hypothetical protein
MRTQDVNKDDPKTCDCREREAMGIERQIYGCHRLALFTCMFALESTETP